MKPKSTIVITILGMLSVSSVESVQPAMFTADILRVFNAEFTPEARELMTDLFGEADEKKESVTLNVRDKRWKSCGISNISNDARLLFVRMHEKYGHHVSFTDDGLTIYPRNFKPAQAA